MENSWNLSDTTQLGLKVKIPEPDLSGVYNVNDPMLCDTQKTFDDIVSESIEPLKNTDEWLRENIRKSMWENADIWLELAKY